MAKVPPQEDQPRRLSEEEFADRFHMQYRMLWTVALAVLGGPSEADDAVQEAAIVALRRLDTFSDDANFAAWMAAIVQHTAQNIARGNRRRSARNQTHADALQQHRHEQDAQASVDQQDRLFWPDGTLSDEMDQNDRIILAALQRVPESQRASYLLRIAYSMSYSQIASILGIPQSTARSNVYRARRTLLDEGNSSAKSFEPSHGRSCITEEHTETESMEPRRDQARPRDREG